MAPAVTEELDGVVMRGAHGTAGSLAVWALTRTALLLCVFKVVTVPGPDVTGDVSVIYHGWFEVLKSGAYPLHDVTWQYPPAAALPIASPALLPFLPYASAFFLLSLLCDALVLVLLLRAGTTAGARRRRAAGRREDVTGRSLRGAWVWVAGVPLLGATAYARYDLMVTAVAVAALLAGTRRPGRLGALVAFGALLKIWPVLLLAGTPRGRVTRRAWTTAAVTAAGLLLACSLALPGSLAFLAFQRDRGTEIESLGALGFHVARHFGWQGSVLLNYGSVEYLGPGVHTVSTASLALTVAGFCWLLFWRLSAREFTVSTPCDAALCAVLLFTTTSRVISPQYMIWLVGLAAACLVLRASSMVLPACLVLAATGVTQLEFPLWFAHVVAGDGLGILLLAVRNGLLVAATLIACRRLWRQTMSGPGDQDETADTPGKTAPGLLTS